MLIRFGRYIIPLPQRAAACYPGGMNAFPRLRLWLLLFPALAMGAGCGGEPTQPTTPARPEVKRSEMGRHVWMETEGDRRRVRVEAKVCLRKGEYGLECLLCRAKTKDYESVLATSADAQVIHTALIAAGANPGSPVHFEQGGFTPPTGSRIKIRLEYEDKGKVVNVPAGHFLRDVKTKKEPDADWVFAGSLLWPNPDGNDKPKIYGANTDGAYICVINVPTAMLDLPIHTPTNPENRSFEPFTENIPEVGTAVVLILEPVEAK
jgi:hypothetical protein